MLWSFRDMFIVSQLMAMETCLAEMLISMYKKKNTPALFGSWNLEISTAIFISDKFTYHVIFSFQDVKMSP